MCMCCSPPLPKLAPAREGRGGPARKIFRRLVRTKSVNKAVSEMLAFFCVKSIREVMLRYKIRRIAKVKEKCKLFCWSIVIGTLKYYFWNAGKSSMYMNRIAAGFCFQWSALGSCHRSENALSNTRLLWQPTGRWRQCSMRLAARMRAKFRVTAKSERRHLLVLCSTDATGNRVNYYCLQKFPIFREFYKLQLCSIYENTVGSCCE